MGSAAGLVMDGAINRSTLARKGKNRMADDDTLFTSPASPDTAVHVADYSRFIQMMKYGAVVCFIIGFIVLLILK